MRIDVRMPAGEGVAAGQVATFKLPIGRRYHELRLKGAATAFVVANLTEIRVFCNNKIIQRFSGTQRDIMNQFDGRRAADTSAAGFSLVIPFDRNFLNTNSADEETALNTGSLNEKTGEIITSFYLEIDLAAAGITGTPSLTMNATVSEALPGGPGTVMHIQRHTRDIAGAGDYDLVDLPRGGVTTAFLNRIFFDPSANNITRVKIEADQRIWFDREAADNRFVQVDGVRIPQGDMFVIDRTEKGYGGDPLNLQNLQDYRYLLTVDGAMTLTAITEYMGRLGD